VTPSVTEGSKCVTENGIARGICLVDCLNQDNLNNLNKLINQSTNQSEEESLTLIPREPLRDGNLSLGRCDSENALPLFSSLTREKNSPKTAGENPAGSLVESSARNSSGSSAEADPFVLQPAFPLPEGLERPAIRAAWEDWIRWRKFSGGAERISRKSLQEIFEVLRHAFRIGGEQAVKETLEHSTRTCQVNRLLVPKDVYRTPRASAVTRPSEPEVTISEEERLAVSSIISAYREKTFGKR